MKRVSRRLPCLVAIALLESTVVGAEPVGVPSTETVGEAPTVRRAVAPDASDLSEVRRLLRARRFDEAVARLEKLDRAAGSGRNDIQALLSMAYYRAGAYQKAEEAARRLVDDVKDDTSALIRAYFLVGRAQAAGEKTPVRLDSERLCAAEASFRKVVELSHGRSQTGRLALAETLIRLDQGDEARAQLTALLPMVSTSAPISARVRRLLQTPRCATAACLPDLSFITSDGHRGTQDDLRGKVVLLSFWASWCGHCVEAASDLKRLRALHQDEPFEIVGVNVDHDRAAMDSFVARHEIPWPQALEETDRLAEAFERGGLPTEVLFDREGVLLTSTVGWGPHAHARLTSFIDGALGRAGSTQRAEK